MDYMGEKSNPIQKWADNEVAHAANKAGVNNTWRYWSFSVSLCPNQLQLVQNKKLIP